MTFRKTVRKLHLWLGLASGLLVCFLGITGCILAFEREIEHFTAPYQFVSPQSASLLPPSQLKAIAERSLSNGRKVVSLEYGDNGKAALAYYYNEQEYWQVFLNPYTGEVLKRKNIKHDFFRIITDGHYSLWLPHQLGQPIVASATLVFVVMTISGLILWWPKNKAARKQRFSVKWNARWRRVNYDLHNVLGFYTTWVCIFIAASGLVMGFQWAAKALYWASSGGKTMPVAAATLSDTTLADARPLTDLAWERALALLQADKSLSITFPATRSADIVIAVNNRPGTFYNQDVYHYDQYTLKPLQAGGIYDGLYLGLPTAAKLNRMNYDIHVGAIGGLATKLLAFFASLTAASLPITGFLIWRGRKKKSRVKPEAPVSKRQYQVQ